MKSTEPVLLAKCNHIFAWPFEYQWPKDDVENYAEPFKKKGWIEKDMDIQGTTQKRLPKLLAHNTIGRIPDIPWISPSRPISPAIITLLTT